MSVPGLLVSQDLFFSGKVTGTARALGLQVDVAGGLDGLRARLAGQTYGCVILDLALPNVAVSDLLAELPVENRPHVIAFGSHVQTARLQEARDAGCDEVLPRSRFDATLPDLLRRVLAENDAGNS